MTKDQAVAVAALRSAAKACELCAGVASDTDAEEWRADAERVRAIADTIERAQEACQGPDYADQISTDAVIGWSPVWIIPAPRLP